MNKLNKENDAIVENLPLDWKLIAFMESFESLIDFRGRTPKKLGMDWGGGDIPALSANNVKMGKIDLNSPTYYGSEELYSKWMTKGDLRKGDVLMTMEAPMGNIAQVPDNRKYILSQRVIAIKPIKKLWNTYFKYYLMSPIFQELLDKYSTGTTAKGISQKNLYNLLVVVPPLEEQQKIASILSFVDEAIEKTESIIEQTEKVKQGLMQQLLTKGIGHTKFKETEIGEIPEEWEIKALGTIGTWSGGGTPSKKEPSYWSKEKKVIWVSPKDMYSNIITSSEDFITEKGLREKKLKLLPKGTILFVTRSSILKKRVPIAVAGESLTINQDLKALQVASNIDYEFIFYALLALNDSIRTSCVKTGTTVESIDFQSLQEVLIPIPPLSEQREIVKIIGTYYKKLENEKGYLKPLNSLKKGLMQSLLTGKVRVKVDETEVKPVCPPL